MKNKIIFVVCLTASAPAFAGLSTITLINSTNCEVIGNGNTSAKIVHAVPVFSMYYDSECNPHYYGSIPEYGSGKAAVSPQPSFGNALGIDLSYSPSPYAGGGFGGIGITSGSHIVQRILVNGYCPPNNPCLDVIPIDPCWR